MVPTIRVMERGEPTLFDKDNTRFYNLLELVNTEEQAEVILVGVCRCVVCAGSCLPYGVAQDITGRCPSVMVCGMLIKPEFARVTDRVMAIDTFFFSDGDPVRVQVQQEVRFRNTRRGFAVLKVIV